MLSQGRLTQEEQIASSKNTEDSEIVDLVVVYGSTNPDMEEIQVQQQGPSSSSSASGNGSAPKKIKWLGAHCDALKPIEMGKFICDRCNKDMPQFTFIAYFDNDGNFSKTQNTYIQIPQPSQEGEPHLRLLVPRAALASFPH